MHKTPKLRRWVLVISVGLLTACSSKGSTDNSPRNGGPSAPGNINLTTISGEQSFRFTGTFIGDVTVPVQNINAGATPAQAMNAFLAQYAFYLFTNDAQEERSALDLISDRATTRAEIAAGRAAFRKQVGPISKAMPIFWDTKQSPVRFTATQTAAGTKVTLSGGTLYYSVYNPPKSPGNLKWQDPRGRDHRTTVTELTATFGPTTNSNGYSLSPVRSYSFH